MISSLWKSSEILIKKRVTWITTNHLSFSSLTKTYYITICWIASTHCFSCAIVSFKTINQELYYSYRSDSTGSISLLLIFCMRWSRLSTQPSNRAKTRVPKTDNKFNSKTLVADGKSDLITVFAKLPHPCATKKATEGKAMPIQIAPCK